MNSHCKSALFYTVFTIIVALLTAFNIYEAITYMENQFTYLQANDKSSYVAACFMHDFFSVCTIISIAALIANMSRAVREWRAYRNTPTIIGANGYRMGA